MEPLVDGVRLYDRAFAGGGAKCLNRSAVTLGNERASHMRDDAGAVSNVRSVGAKAPVTGRGRVVEAAVSERRAVSAL